MTANLSEFFISIMPALSEEGRAFLCRTVEEQHFSAAEAVFQRGEAVAGLYFIRSGRIGIRKETGFEDKTQVIALLDAGAPLGERGLLQNMVHGAGAFAVEDSVVALLPFTEYSQLMRQMPEDGRVVLEWVLLQISRRLEKASERLAHIL